MKKLVLIMALLAVMGCEEYGSVFTEIDVITIDITEVELAPFGVKAEVEISSNEPESVETKPEDVESEIESEENDEDVTKPIRLWE